MTTKQVRLLIFRGGAIGDFILTLPALRLLRERWPDAYIELVGYPHVAELARAGGLVDRVVSLDRAETARFFALRPAFSEAQAEHLRSFDVVVTFLHDPDEVVLTNLRLAGARQVVYGSPIVTAGHAAEHLCKPLEALAIYAGEAVPRLTLPPELLEKGRAWLADRGLDRPRWALHPGSGSAEKNWPLERFLELAHRLTAAGRSVFFVIGEADARALEGLERRAAEIHVLTGCTLVELAAVLAHCDGYVGNDSGITHLAAAVGPRVVALFGPTRPDMWGPRGARVALVQAPGGRMEALGVDAVWKVAGA